ncbi:low molecular weight phosphotyrosine protein phosphatase [Rhodobacterales bacterium HKCCE2091]|nr:low molecular weight phosphotyrosine protein phosphatase [Rhodobacterales bacterium HKCCE2091]
MTDAPFRILAVCLGNICRSPTAEAVLRATLPGAEIDSAGTGNWHVGNPPHPPAIRAAAARGYDLAPLRARQVRASDFHDFDLVLAMDDDNFADLTALRPPDARAELRLFLDPLGGGAVPDPYYTGDFDGVLDLIEAGARAWADQLHMDAAISPKAR